MDNLFNGASATGNPRTYYILLAVFVVSGFAGLIYESVWAQYLKLFLGHAAYAQTMVLCIFMGGLALGAWLAARYSRRITHPLIAYAAIEAAIGLLGLVFHGVFTRAVEFHYQHLLPLTTDPLATATVKGALALLLIGPQTVLLGATFPLMTAGVLRALPQSSGHKISMLYFSNSIGAAAGVLASVFILIPWSGLPGTILSAGLVNILIALVVWLIVRRGAIVAGSVDWAAASGITAAPAGSAKSAHASLSPRLVLGVAAFTGLASFIYEVVWIRMLSLVLGASTHSFELMLSAFITGLALGSLAIRRWVDRIREPYRVLGYIQILMGLFALGSLWVYSESFHWMATILNAIARSEQGYALFLLASHGVCFAIMLPATFMAGMTLPLITHGLLRDGYGERALGTVYSVNTLGSIIGVIIALHFAIPLTGLKNALIIGGGLDMLIGVVLIAVTAGGLAALRPAAAVGVSIAGVFAVTLGVTLDPHKLNSGVYRYGRAILPQDFQFLFNEDGKTATISLYQGADGGRVLATNGKPDGRIDAFKNVPSGDDVTTTLLGGMGMAFFPDARSAANIGLGTGVTTRMLLRNPRLERVDTVEIEEKVVSAVHLLRDEVDVVFTDRRSRIIVDDAKSYFAAQRARYDIIVAEPSNPWVSGVASLFTGEFYRRMADHLTKRGVLVQWLQTYEIDLESIASVMLALGRVFPSYTIYTTNGTDILVVAWKGDEPREPDAAVLAWPELQADWQRVGVDGIADIEARRIGSKRVLHPLFRSYAVPENSDFFPYLDNRAARARFLRHSADGLSTLRTSALPLIEMLEERALPYAKTSVSQRTFVHRSIAMRDALAAYHYLRGDKVPDGLLPATRGELAVYASYCNGGLLFSDAHGLNAVIGVAVSVVPYLTPEESRQAISPLLNGKCIARLGDTGRLVAVLIERIIARDGHGMRLAGEQLLAGLPKEADRRLMGFAVDSAMVGAIMSGAPGRARELWGQYGKQVQTGTRIPLENRLMLSLAEVRMKQR